MARHSPVTVTRPGQEPVELPAAAFRKPKTKKGRCTRCGMRVRWQRSGHGHWQLVERGGLENELHHCTTPAEGARRSE